MRRPGRLTRILALNTVANLSWMPKRARTAIYRRSGVAVGSWTTIFPAQQIRPGRITIGREVFINTGGVFDPGSASITIGDKVTIGVAVILTASTHAQGPPSQRAGGQVSAPVTIGDGCWLGARVTVLPGVAIAAGCVIAAGSVVTKDTLPNGLYAGVPATRRRDLSKNESPFGDLDDATRAGSHALG